MAAAFRRLLLRGLLAGRSAATTAPAPAPRSFSTSTTTGGSHVTQGHQRRVRLPHLSVADTPYLGRAARGRVPTTACDGFPEAVQDYRRAWWKSMDARTGVGMLFIGALWPIKVGMQAIDPSYEYK